MAVPTYDKFIEPVLRFLAGKPDGVPDRDAHEAAADALNLDDNQRAEVIASGQLVYKNRAVGHMIV
ncbi:methylated adenine and cytosine restriction protein [Escherichia coli]|jgi:restriction system protein|nr:methylated adenine and cytosine restriction protein [Escherichia coli]CTU47705.1 methylated adenine and cytosine restriction protein [Escherichia coli]CTU86484.1 methylated adenine and cytosine restriction protein [Escherichia coli]CTV62742.1 methylated adenine and cytosine restriction protein [Escherichia coli]CTW95265.1 methylated adenine and cytosine restriction protein [Escherichia coli]